MALLQPASFQNLNHGLAYTCVATLLVVVSLTVPLLDATLFIQAHKGDKKYQVLRNLSTSHLPR